MSNTEDIIRAGLAKLDPSNDEHWTQAGLPSIPALRVAAGDDTITRSALDAVEPGMRRPERKELQGFVQGSSFEVGGVSGASVANEVDMLVTRGERVVVLTPAQARAEAERAEAEKAGQEPAEPEPEQATSAEEDTFVEGEPTIQSLTYANKKLRAELGRALEVIADLRRREAGGRRSPLDQALAARNSAGAGRAPSYPIIQKGSRE